MLRLALGVNPVYSFRTYRMWKTMPTLGGTSVLVLRHTWSTPRPGVAVDDAGIKAMAILRGLPEVENRPGVTVESFSYQRSAVNRRRTLRTKRR